MATIGKRVVDDLYIHLSAVNQLESADHRALIQAALQRVPADHAAAPNLAKLNLRTGRLSLLAYPDFEEAPFSALSASWAFSDDPAAPPGFRSYDGTLNPPILHRKELMVAPGHPGREAWLQLTASAEALALFDDTTTIGFALNWQRLVQRKGYRLVDGALLPLGNQTADETRRPTSGLDGGRQHHCAAPPHRAGTHRPVSAGATADLPCAAGTDHRLLCLRLRPGRRHRVTAGRGLHRPGLGPALRR